MSSGAIRLYDTQPAGVRLLADVGIILHPDDDVAIVKEPLLSGARVAYQGEEWQLTQMIPAGHKLALRALPAGSVLRRYGQIIGETSADISPGEHVHSHNLSVGNFEREYEYAVDVQPPTMLPIAEAALFSRLPARRWPRRHAQLHRLDEQRQLLRAHGAGHRRGIHA